VKSEALKEVTLEASEVANSFLVKISGTTAVVTVTGSELHAPLLIAHVLLSVLSVC
jgi:hypothetical protein